MLQYSIAVVDHLKLRQVPYTTSVATATKYINAIAEVYASKVSEWTCLEGESEIWFCYSLAAFSGAQLAELYETFSGGKARDSSFVH